MAWTSCSVLPATHGWPKEIEWHMAQAEAESRRTGQPARRFNDFQYTTRKSWSRRRRVIGKAEWTQGEANPRFIVTSLNRAEIDGRYLYEKVYCARGDMENRIKECQMDMFADRTSANTMRANQLRLWLSSMAYVLLCALRRIGLQHTRFAKACCGSIRLALLKIGAVVTTSARRVKFAMASGCPYQARLPAGPRLARRGRPLTKQTAHSRHLGPCAASHRGSRARARSRPIQAQEITIIKQPMRATRRLPQIGRFEKSGLARTPSSLGLRKGGRCRARADPGHGLVVRHETGARLMGGLEGAANVLDVVFVLIDELLQRIASQLTTATFCRASE